MRETLASALRYWEPRRIIYNAALLLVVCGCFVAAWPVSKRALSFEPLLIFFILAVLANIAYCAAYLPDLVIQHAALRGTWLRWRWVLLAVGTLFACAIAYLLVPGVFGFGIGGS